MNREIKFRAWDRKNKMMLFPNKEMLTWYDCKVWLQICHPYNHNYGLNRSPDELENLELMQYTGLKDKNGVEIYEGDIVKTGNLKRYNDKTDIAEIKWFRGGFMLHLNGNFGYRDIERYDNDSELYEIIGNIYSNPELLK